MELGSLLRSEALSVYNQLLLYLSVSYDKVFSGLAMLASKDDTYTGPKDLKTTQHLVRHFLSSSSSVTAVVVMSYSIHSFFISHSIAICPSSLLLYFVLYIPIR